MPVMSLKNWFSLQVVRDKRSEIAATIRQLAPKFNSTNSLVFPQIVFTEKDSSVSGYPDDEEVSATEHKPEELSLAGDETVVANQN